MTYVVYTIVMHNFLTPNEVTSVTCTEEKIVHNVYMGST